MSVLPVPLSIILPTATPVGVVPMGAVPVRPVLLPPDGGGLGALGSGFNI